MEKLSIISLVLISVFIIGVESRGTREVTPDSSQVQRGPAVIPQQPLLPSILPLINRTILQDYINRYYNLSDHNRNIWNKLVLHAGQVDNNAQNLTLPPGVSPSLYRRYMDKSELNRRLWLELMLNGYTLPEEKFIDNPAQNDGGAESLLPGSKRQQDNTAGASRKVPRTQDNAAPRRGTLRIQEPIEISSDESGESQKEIDLALRMFNEPNKGKNKMTEIPSQHFKKPADNPVDKGSAETSRQPNAAIGTSSSRVDPGPALAINENAEHNRAPQQDLGFNNVLNDLAPEDFLSLAVNENSSYTRK